MGVELWLRADTAVFGRTGVVRGNAEEVGREPVPEEIVSECCETSCNETYTLEDEHPLKEHSTGRSTRTAVSKPKPPTILLTAAVSSKNIFGIRRRTSGIFREFDFANGLQYRDT